MLRQMFRCLAFVSCAAGISLTQESSSIPIAHITLPEPAYIGMPVWMTIQSTTGDRIRYPSSTSPNDFYCNQVEVRRGMHSLQPLVGFPAAGRGGPACGWLGIPDIAESKLPIHLQYSLTEPGTYLVRFTGRRYRQAKLKVAEQSEWTPLHLEVAPPDAIENWLARKLATLPDAPGPLLGDALPSLLASRDERVLRVMLEKTYDPNSAVAGYAANSLVFFEKEHVRSQLLSTLKDRGPNDALGYLFATTDIARPIAAQIVIASLPYLRSSVPEKVVGALHVLSMMREPSFQLPAETVEQIATILQGEVDFVIAQRNEEAALWLANFAGVSRRPADRTLLWKLVDAGLATEQSLICITWFREPADLPRIVSIVKQATYSNSSDPHGYEHSGTVGHLQTEYGTVARPYLRDLLESSKQTWVRTAAAKGLVEMNDPAGWQFFLEAVSKSPFYKDEMVRWLGDRFPSLRNTDDAALLSLLQTRVSASSTVSENK